MVYPTKLLMDGKPIGDKLPEWNSFIRVNRLDPVGGAHVRSVMYGKIFMQTGQHAMTQSENMQHAVTSLPGYGVQASVDNSPSSNPYVTVNPQYNVKQNPNICIGYTNRSPNPAPSHNILNPMSNTQSPLPYQHSTIAPPNYVLECVGNNSVQPTQTSFSGPDSDMSPHQHILSTDKLIPRATQ
jgi:hypothetical protein